MKIQLLNFANEKFFVEIPDDTEAVAISLISGDMVMTYPVFYDTGKFNRLHDYFDCSCIIKKEKFNKLNDLKSSYDLINLEKEGGEE